MHHHDTDSEPQVVFSRNPTTNEFRESVSGWFYVNHPLTISYDPTRIVPAADNYQFGDPFRPIVAHVQFQEHGPVSDVRLQSLIGTPACTATSSAYRAPKLVGRIDIPQDAAWVSMWITYARGDGTTLYDSSYGRNFRFRFYHEELSVVQSDVLPEPGSPTGRLALRVAIDSTVDRVLVRYRVLTDPLPAESKSVDLSRTGQNDSKGRTIWELNNVNVPADRVTAYDFIYFADNRPFKDNNQGQFFLAYAPEKRIGQSPV